MPQCPQCSAVYASDVVHCPIDGARLPSDRDSDSDLMETAERRTLPAKGGATPPGAAPAAEAPTVRAPQQQSRSAAVAVAAAAAAADPVTAETAELGSGTMVGEYRITARIGKGGMGTVYSGVQPLIGKKVAIKVLDATLSTDASIVQRFIQEARAVNQIGHKNIVDIFSFGTLAPTLGARCYFVMEFLSGRNLYMRLTTPDAPVGYEESFAILGSVCDALAAAHAEHIVHRDLKPENIFLAEAKTGERTVKLLDFGIAKLLRESNGRHATKAGVPMGTPLYMSPEQCMGNNVDHRTDIYAVGVLMYEMFTGRVPFPGPSYAETVSGHISKAPPPPTDFVDIPLSLESLIVKCLEKDPDKRPLTMVEVRDELKTIAATMGIEIGRRPSLPPAPTDGAVTPAPVRKTPPSSETRPPMYSPSPSELSLAGVRPKGRRSAALLLGGALLVAGASIGSAMWVKSRRLAAAAAATIDLQVGSDPTGAVVYIDGVPQALLTPNTFKLHRAAKYDILLRKEGFLPLSDTVTLAEGQTQYAMAPTLVPLKEPSGKLEIRTVAHHARWTIDGKEAGDESGVLRIEDVAPGKHKVAVESHGFERREAMVDIAANELASFEWTLVAVEEPAPRPTPHPSRQPPPHQPAPALKSPFLKSPYADPPGR